MPFRHQPAPRIMPRRGLFYALTAFRQVTSAHNSSQQPARLRSGFGQFGLSHQYSDRNINPAPLTRKPHAHSLVRNGAQQLRQAALYRAICSRYRAAQFDLQFSCACTLSPALQGCSRARHAASGDAGPCCGGAQPCCTRLPPSLCASCAASFARRISSSIPSPGSAHAMPQLNVRCTSGVPIALSSTVPMPF